MTYPNGEKKEVLFDLLENQKGIYETTVVAVNEGAYDVLIELEGNNNERVNINSNFMVVFPFQEIKETWLDSDKLKAIANTTGGGYYNPDEIAAIPDAIPDLSRKLSYDSPPMPIWDNRIVFIILFLLLVSEWAFRKKYKLI